ncbi:hypothetical protein MCAP1_002609 [Malassezia caprae]|uniref:Splicing factor subunit n=1 Tax=Malassezia caprae TaxID=1381934 RepID=A0AAF0J0U9_9BASI|nr:hypothetical protein MCAP1_002609 [Malassezia caprae]
MSELRYGGNPQLEHLHAREWAVHQHRDTSAAVVAQVPLLTYMAVADGESRARMRFRQCERMLQPCGPPPETQELI